LAGVAARKKVRFGFIAPFTRLCKFDDRMLSARKQLLFAAIAIGQPPQFLSIGLDKDEEAAAIGFLEGLCCGLQTADIGIAKHVGKLAQIAISPTWIPANCWYPMELLEIA
jgi:hypothetical protein